MSVFLLWVALAGAPDETALTDHQADAAGARSIQAEPRPLFEIHKELRQLMRDEAVGGKDREAWELTVVKLAELYSQITRDERLPSSDALNGYRIKLRSRLLRIQKQLERKLGSAKKARSSAGENLAAVPGNAAAEAEARRTTRKTGSLSSFTNGTETVLPHGTRGGAALDSGRVLVELIQRTIAPDFWDVNGGPGTIVYYRQWHALVVRATPEIHRRIGGAVHK